MKKLVFILFLFVGVLKAQSYYTTIIFINDKTEQSDTCYFELDYAVKECSKIDETLCKERGKLKPGGMVNYIVYDFEQGVISYKEYMGDFHCWAPIIYNKKRLYLLENSKLYANRSNSNN